MGLLRNPPLDNKNGALKDRLPWIYQLFDEERANRLLLLDGLEDSKPLMEKMLALLCSSDASFFFTHLFLCQLPPPVGTALASSTLVQIKYYRGLAEEVERTLACLLPDHTECMHFFRVGLHKDQRLERLSV